VFAATGVLVPFAGTLAVNFAGTLMVSFAGTLMVSFAGTLVVAAGRLTLVVSFAGTLTVTTTTTLRRCRCNRSSSYFRLSSFSYFFLSISNLTGTVRLKFL
jgi:hypothetical protein